MADDEESFIILNSMDELESHISTVNDSINLNDANQKMEISTQTSNGYSSTGSANNNGEPSSLASSAVDKENSNPNVDMTNSKFSMLQEAELSGPTSIIGSDNTMPSLITVKIGNLSSIRLGSESIASQFTLGAIDGETLKSGILSSFPSLISKDAHPDDLHKFQCLVNEHKDLRDQLQKTNIAMRQQYSTIQSYQMNMNTKIEEYVKTIDDMKVDNSNLKSELDNKVKQHELNTELMKKENFDLTTFISEKNAIIQNMTQQIKKLEAEKENFVYIQANAPTSLTSNARISEEEFENVIAVYKSEISLLTAKNLEFEEMRSVYIDEIDCLKVNLVSAEELYKSLQATCLIVCFFVCLYGFIYLTTS